MRGINKILRKVLAVALWVTTAQVAFAQINTEQVMNIGRNALYFEDYILSIQYFNQVIAQKPYLAEPYFFRAVAKISLDDYSGAEADATRCIEINPFIKDAYRVRGVARHNTHNFEQAIDDYKKCLELRPGDKDIMLNMAMCELAQKHFERADSCLKWCLERDSTSERTFLGLAQLNLEKQDTTQALSYLSRAIELNKNNTQAFLMRCEIYFSALGDIDKALADAAATKAELGEAKSSLTTELKAYADAVKTEAIAAANLAAAAAAKNAQDIQETKNQIKEELKNYATQEVVEIISGENGLQAQVNGLVKTLEAITGEENMKELVEIVGSFDTIVDALFSAVTSVELYASYSDWGNWNDGRNSVTGQFQFYNYGNNNYGGQIYPLWIGLTHGTIAETSVFGDKGNTIDESDPLLYYTKGDDIKDPSYLVVRVNPVNADITAAAAAGKILLINSKGESLEDIVKVTKAERYNQLITRGQTINTGLWKLSFKVADGIEQEAFYEATTSLENGWRGNILYAVAINNTNNEGAAGRYVASTFDIELGYNEYVPATRFTFSVNNGITNTSVEEIHNRWTGAQIQGEETATLTTNPELEWLQGGVIPTAVPVGLNDPANPTNVKINANTWDYLNNNYQITNLKDDRYQGLNYVSVAVGKPFTINAVQAFAGEIGYPYRVSIDSLYVVLDKVNAIESAPSEINAWNSYSYTGLQKTVDATKPLEITINSETANGDIIGFRVFAVNRDGSLVDPDGRSFYVYVGEGDSNMQIVSGNVVAVKPAVKSEDLKTIAVKFDANVTYGAWEIVNEVEEFPQSTQPTINNENKCYRYST